ncbi:MAG TPA: cobalamin-dependent protein, partial [Anaerolineales bacterium]|nr:cobalamin-dependent protein [Anaerolineales bacterium]
QLTIKADLILLHAPSVFDFRQRDDVLFAYLSDSDSVNVTSIFEMYPLGFLSLQAHLQQHGIKVVIINLASLMLQHSNLDIDRLLAHLEAPVFGLDLHWMAHCHGSIEVAQRVKAIHPDSLVIFGGLSATYFADQLIQYPAIDLVVQGYDTLEPVRQLVQSVIDGSRNLAAIPNLVYRQPDKTVAKTGYTHQPSRKYNDAAIQWSFYRDAISSPTVNRLIMTLPNSGCAHDCGWCGGSRSAFVQPTGTHRSLVYKDHKHIVAELASMADAARQTSIYALQCYSEPPQRMYEYLDTIQDMGYKSVSFELYNLPDEKLTRRIAQATQAYVLLSPESHDQEISRLAGRGNYSMAQMEAWIEKALDSGIAGVMVWFFIGMPRQTSESVMETVNYCERLIRRFPGRKVIPLLCPMVPFLDPGSRFYEKPEAHGYRIFFHDLEQYRQAMVAPLWYQRLNYETDWLSRRQLQNVTYESISRLVEIKGELGMLPKSFTRGILMTIDETQSLLAEIESVIQSGAQLTSDLRAQIHLYNQKILATSSDQIVPIPRPIGSRWFDDMAVSQEIIKDCIIA